MIVADHAGHPLLAGGRPAGIQGASPALPAVSRRHRRGLFCICRADQDDLEVARSVTKGPGRLEERTLTTSSLVQGYTDWPYLKQAFKLERRVVHLRQSKSGRLWSTA